MNNSMIVGRIYEFNVIDQSTANISLAVPRPTDNNKNVITDLIPCLLTGNISTTFVEHCQVGDVVGVRGRLQVDNKILHLLVDRITFLNSKKANEE